MKPIEELLQHLARPEVLEFGLVSNRLPSVNIHGRFTPVDDDAPTNEAIREVLGALGGNRLVDGLGERPLQWTARVAGVGIVAIAAIARGSMVQARFTVARRDARLGSTARLPAASAPPPPVYARQHATPTSPEGPVGVVPRPQAARNRIDVSFDEEGPATPNEVAVALAVGRPSQTEPPSSQEAPESNEGDIEIVLAASAPSTSPSPSQRDEEPSGEVRSFLHEMLAAAVAMGASDLHVQSDRLPAFRIKGEITTAPLAEAIDRARVAEVVREILPSRLREQFDREGCVDFAFDPRGSARYRMHLGRVHGGYRIAARVLPRELPEVPEIAIGRSGLVLVVGPPGVGKSTTVAALVERKCRERGTRIVTLEDPIERLHPPAQAVLTQRELGRDVRSYASGIATALREGADVIVVGTLSAESASAVIGACDAGKLVFATANAGEGTTAAMRARTLVGELAGLGITMRRASDHVTFDVAPLGEK